MIRALLFVLLLVSAPAFADPWDATDYTLETFAAVAQATDWSQTVYAAKRPDRFHERNPIYGTAHPTVGQVNVLCASAMIGTVLLANYLSTENRQTFLIFVSLVEIYAVGTNRIAGIRVSF